MHRSIIAAAAVATTLAAGTAFAQVTVEAPWVRSTAPGQKAAGAYMQLKSAEGAALVAADSPTAQVVEIHEMRMEGGTMRMRAIPKLDLPPGQTVELKPGGYHVMLIDLKQPLKKGDTVPIILKVEGRDRAVRTIEVKAEVKDAPMPGGMQHGK